MLANGNGKKTAISLTMALDNSQATPYIQIIETGVATMFKFAILVFNGFSYEYETTIFADSIKQARKIWKLRDDWKAENFRVSKIV